MRGYFITGTDTGVGKTVVSAILTYFFKGYYWKPIQSGIQESIADVEEVRQFTGFSQDHFLSSRYLLQAALSPDQAAGKQGVKIDLNELEMPEIDKTLIIEGVGGVYVPLNDSAMMLDLMKKFNLPVIIVARGGLGTINHTLLTIEGLRTHGLLVHGVVFSGELNPDNQKAIEKWGRVCTLFHVPFFAPLNAQILRRWASELKFIITA